MQGVLGMLSPAAVKSCCWKIKQKGTMNVMNYVSNVYSVSRTSLMTSKNYLIPTKMRLNLTSSFSLQDISLERLRILPFSKQF